jgi:hypothetical protein
MPQRPDSTSFGSFPRHDRKMRSMGQQSVMKSDTLSGGAEGSTLIAWNQHLAISIGAFA